MVFEKRASVHLFPPSVDLYALWNQCGKWRAYSFFHVYAQFIHLTPAVTDSDWEKEQSKETDTEPPDLNKGTVWKMFSLVFPQLRVWLQRFIFGLCVKRRYVCVSHSHSRQWMWVGVLWRLCLLVNKESRGWIRQLAPKIDPTTQTFCLCLCALVFLQSQWGRQRARAL